MRNIYICVCFLLWITVTLLLSISVIGLCVSWSNKWQELGSEQDFIEGYGYVTRDGKLPYSHEDFDKNGNWLPEAERRQPTPGINIKIISEDNECDVDVEEITSN